MKHRADGRRLAAVLFMTFAPCSGRGHCLGCAGHAPDGSRHHCIQLIAAVALQQPQRGRRRAVAAHQLGCVLGTDGNAWNGL